MARSYSAVMALVGMVVVLLRGMKNGAGFDDTVMSGIIWMIILGAIGWVVGVIALQTVDESVRTKIEAELADLVAPEETDPSTPVA